MANIFAPNGFSQYQGTGSTPTFEQTQMVIASGNATPIYFGDPVVQATGTTGLGTGYIAQASAPQALAISVFALLNGLVTATFAATTAPPVGSYLVLQGLTTATTLNGTWQVISSTTTTAVFSYAGGPITTQATTGYLFTPVAGIFVGCRYLSTANKYPVWRNYWPGSDANGDVTAYIVNDPNAQFIAQAGNSNTTMTTPIGITSIGQNIGFNLGTGNSANGLSGSYVDQYTLAANYPASYTGQNFLPFRVIGLANYVPGNTTSLASQPLGSVPGNDFTNPFNKIIVGFNNSMPRQLAGI